MQILSILLIVSMAQSPPGDAIARARQAYNNRQFDNAIAAARDAEHTPAVANAAAVVLGRSLLERFRLASDPSDLEAARAALGRVQPDLLSAADRSEFFVGLGVSLYIDGCAEGCYSAAAEYFDLAASLSNQPDPIARESVFEWWATALDHQAQYAADEDRPPIYKRILERAEEERRRDSSSASAAYWIAAAARGVGDFTRAWGAAVTGWIHAKYLGPRGQTLRADLNYFVTQVLLPEHVRQMPLEGDRLPTLEGLRKQWADVQERYK